MIRAGSRTGRSRRVRATCVPPQSSRLKPPMSTTRTRSPYFSPNSAITPSALASSSDFSVMVSGTSARIFSLTIASTRAISSAVIAALWVKSKRRRSASTSEPDCSAPSPSTLRSAWCSRCVAVWLRWMSGAGGVDLRHNFVADVKGALLDDAVMDAIAFRSIRADNANPRRAVGRFERARVAGLAAGGRVERRAVEEYFYLPLAAPLVHGLALRRDDADDLGEHRFVGVQVPGPLDENRRRDGWP